MTWKLAGTRFPTRRADTEPMARDDTPLPVVQIAPRLVATDLGGAPSCPEALSDPSGVCSEWRVGRQS
jgi:hypothetical protein